MNDAFILHPFKEPIMHIVTLNGDGFDSSVNYMQQGLIVRQPLNSQISEEEMVNCWCIGDEPNSTQSAYIVTSYLKSTKIIFAMTDDDDSNIPFKLLTTVASIGICVMRKDILLQVHKRGYRITGSYEKNWNTDDETTITSCAVNENQVVLILGKVLTNL